MKKLRFIGSISALLAAVGILFLSLSSASVNVVRSTAGGFEQTRKQFYVSDTILPDHIAYPVLMAIDRARLEAATQTEQVYLKTAYANRRLSLAQQLFDKGDEQLAVSTLTKAQKYLLSASNQALDTDMPDSVMKHLISTLEFHRETTTELAVYLSDSNRAVVDKLNEECRVMVEQLKSRL